MSLKEKYERKIQSGELKLPAGTKEVIILSRYSNIRFLPIYYFLPLEIVAVSKECWGIPRCPLEALSDEHWQNVILSDSFMQLIIEGVAYLAWPHLGIADPKEAFSMNDPIYRMSYFTPWLIEEIYNIPIFNLNHMFKMKRGEQYPIYPMEIAKIMMEASVKIAIKKHNLEPIIEAVKKNRCDEDFTNRQSHAKIDFLRKKYHKRDFSDVQEVSLDEINEKAQELFERTGIDIPDGLTDVEEEATENALVGTFTNKLSDRDMKILQLKMEGCTYQEIADRVGYKTHSAVKKRIDKIAEMWLDYVDENNGIGK